METTIDRTQHGIHATTIVFLSAEVLDALTTLVALTRFNIFAEQNPVVNHIGWLSAMLFKLAMTVAVVWFLQTPKWPIFHKIDWIFPIAAGLPVLWNLFQLVKVVVR